MNHVQPNSGIPQRVTPSEPWYYSAITGKGSVAAAQLAIEDAGPVLGRPVELVTADHMQKADIGSAVAREWYDAGGVDAIFDGAGSSVALAIL